MHTTNTIYNTYSNSKTKYCGGKLKKIKSARDSERE